MIVSYSRKALGQTGDGHYSPIGGYHAATDQVLILDVARCASGRRIFGGLSGWY